MTIAVISIHDVAPATLPACQRLLDLVETIDATASLLVVAGPWREPSIDDSAHFGPWLRSAEARGHEIVVHGWEHRAVNDPAGRTGRTRRIGDRLIARGCAEFGALGRDEALRRSAAGLSVLTGLGTSPIGFTPPGWLASPDAEQALAAVGFEYTTTRTAVIDLVRNRRVEIPALSHRSASPLAGVAARTIMAIGAHRCRHGDPVRLALHPPDVLDVRLATATEQLIDVIGASTLVPITYDRLVAAHRDRLDGIASADAEMLADLPIGPIHDTARVETYGGAAAGLGRTARSHTTGGTR
ncbi:MAG: polysaccharide deacetylase family protein [Actinomycetota bacterium]